MSEKVFFADVTAHRASADALFARVESRLRTLLPPALIEHVGSTALPDGLTKGDLDVQVRVHADAFDDACRILALEYACNPGGFTDGGRSVKDDDTTPQLGVHVTAIGGSSDIQYWQRDLLRARPDLRAEYDAVKRTFDGGDMTAYREAKDHFFSSLVTRSDQVEIVDYDPRWPAMFEEEAARLRATLPDVLAVEHFGSTAVPNLASKPIIDILVIVSALATESRVKHLASLSYVFWEGNPKKDRLFFVKGMPPFGPRRTHHVHVTEPSGELVERLLFRDYLRAHPVDGEVYVALKRELAGKHRLDREAYTEAKSALVLEIMRKARRAT